MTLTPISEEYGKTKDDLLALFGDPLTEKKQTSSSRNPKKTLPFKRFTNEYTGQTVIAKSFKNPTLQQWKNEYGKETVESWGVVIDEREARASMTAGKVEDIPASPVTTPIKETTTP